YACAAVVVGASAPASAPPPGEELQKTVARAMSRRDRKALGLQASRFGFENVDWPRWQHAVLRTADRLGLLLAADGGGGARVAGALAGRATRQVLRAGGRARDLLRFAIGESSPALWRGAGVG